MKQQLINTGILVAVAACLALPAGAQQQQPEPANQNDPFYTKPPKVKVPEDQNSKQPVLIPFPSFEQRNQEYMQARQLARSQGRPEPDPIGQYLVSELTVTGVFETDRGPGAFIQAAPTNSTFFVYNGTRVYNGEIVGINTGSDFNLGQVMFRELTKYRVKKKEIEQVNTVTKSVGAGAGR